MVDHMEIANIDTILNFNLSGKAIASLVMKMKGMKKVKIKAFCNILLKSQSMATVLARVPKMKGMKKGKKVKVKKICITTVKFLR